MCELNIYLCFRMLQFREIKDNKESFNLCNHSFNHKCSIKCDFSSFEILCRKVKRLDQSQDYFHLTSLKIFLEMEEIEYLDKVSRTCLSLLLLLLLLLISISRDCECFCHFKRSLYKVRLECVSSPLYPFIFSTIKYSNFNGKRDYQDHEPRPYEVGSF